MRRGRSVFVFVFVVSLFAVVATRADASAPPVALGEVRVPEAEQRLEPEFRAAVQHELDGLSFEKVKDRYILSASLVRISTQKNDGQTESTAVVSATLRRERGGTLHAIIQGRARAVDDPNQSKFAERSAMRGAVRSALGRVPEALK